MQVIDRSRVRSLFRLMRSSRRNSNRTRTGTSASTAATSFRYIDAELRITCRPQKARTYTYHWQTRRTWC